MPDNESRSADGRKQLVELLRRMATDFQANRSNWENAEVDSFLLAAASWVEDMDGYYENTGRPAPQEPSWAVVADIFQAAKTYE